MDQSTSYFDSYIKHCLDIKRGYNVADANSFFMAISEKICTQNIAPLLIRVLHALYNMEIEYDDFIAIICAKHVHDFCIRSPFTCPPVLSELEKAVVNVLSKRFIGGSVSYAFRSQYEKSLASILVALLKFDSFPNILTSSSVLLNPEVKPLTFSILQQVAEITMGKDAISGSSIADCLGFPSNKAALGAAFTFILIECSRRSRSVSMACSSIWSNTSTSSNAASLSTTDSLDPLLDQLHKEIAPFVQCLHCFNAWNEWFGNLSSSNWNLKIIIDYTITSDLCPISENIMISLVDSAEKLTLVTFAIGGCSRLPILRDVLTTIHELLITVILQKSNSMDFSISNINHSVLEGLIHGRVLPKDIISELKDVVAGVSIIRYFHCLVRTTELIAGGDINSWQLASLQHFLANQETDSVRRGVFARGSLLAVKDGSEDGLDDVGDLSLLVTIAENLSTVVEKFVRFISEPSQLKEIIVLYIKFKYGSAQDHSSLTFWSQFGTVLTDSQPALALGSMTILYSFPHHYVAETLLEGLTNFPNLCAANKTFILTLGASVGGFLSQISMDHCKLPIFTDPRSILLYERKIRSCYYGGMSKALRHTVSSILSFEDESKLDLNMKFRQEVPSLLFSLCKDWNFYSAITENIFTRTISMLDSMYGVATTHDSGTALMSPAWLALVNQLELLVYSCYAVVDCVAEIMSVAQVVAAKSRWMEFMAALTIKFKTLTAHLIEKGVCESLYLVVVKRLLELWIRYMDILSVSEESLSQTVAVVGDKSITHSEVIFNLIQLVCSTFELNSIDITVISSHIIWCLWFNHTLLIRGFALPLSKWYERIILGGAHGDISSAGSSATSNDYVSSSVSQCIRSWDDTQFQERLMYSCGKSIFHLNSEAEFKSLMERLFNLIFQSLDSATRTVNVSIRDRLLLSKISLCRLKGLIGAFSSRDSMASDDEGRNDEDDDNDDNDGDIDNQRTALELAATYIRSNFFMIMSGLIGISIWLQTDIYSQSASSLSSEDLAMADQILDFISTILVNMCSALRLEEEIIVEIITKLKPNFSQLGVNSAFLLNFIASIIHSSVSPSHSSALDSIFNLTTSILQFSNELINNVSDIPLLGDYPPKSKLFFEGGFKVYLQLVSIFTSDIASESSSVINYVDLTAYFIESLTCYVKRSYSLNVPIEASMVRITLAAVRATVDLYSQASGHSFRGAMRYVDSSIAFFEVCFHALFSRDVASKTRRFNFQLLESHSKILFFLISHGLHDVLIKSLSAIVQTTLLSARQTLQSELANISPPLSSDSLKLSQVDLSQLYIELVAAITSANYNSFKTTISRTFKALNSKI